MYLQTDSVSSSVSIALRPSSPSLWPHLSISQFCCLLSFHCDCSLFMPLYKWDIFGTKQDEIMIRLAQSRQFFGSIRILDLDAKDCFPPCAAPNMLVVVWPSCLYDTVVKSPLITTNVSGVTDSILCMASCISSAASFEAFLFGTNCHNNHMWKVARDIIWPNADSQYFSVWGTSMRLNGHVIWVAIFLIHIDLLASPSQLSQKFEIYPLPQSHWCDY